MESSRETVAELTIYYKKQYLTTMLFDKPETADKFVAAIERVLNEKGKNMFTFDRHITAVYTGETIVQEFRDWVDGKLEPKGTILDLMKVIDGLN